MMLLSGGVDSNIGIAQANLEFMNRHNIVAVKLTPLLCHTFDPEVKEKISGAVLTGKNQNLEDDQLKSWTTLRMLNLKL